MQLEVGLVLDGKVTGITKFGAFVELAEGKTGLVHISEVAPTFVKEIRDYVTENQIVKVKILSIEEKGKIGLSMKKALEQEDVHKKNNNFRPARHSDAPRREARHSGGSPSFEDMMARFKKSSDEKMSDLKRGTESKRGGFSRRGGASR